MCFTVLDRHADFPNVKGCDLNFLLWGEAIRDSQLGLPMWDLVSLACRPGALPSVNSAHPPPQDIHEDHDTSTENADESNHDPQFEPIVSLPEQEIKTLEEDEEELFKM